MEDTGETTEAVPQEAAQDPARPSTLWKVVRWGVYGVMIIAMLIWTISWFSWISWRNEPLWMFPGAMMTGYVAALIWPKVSPLVLVIMAPMYYFGLLVLGIGMGFSGSRPHGMQLVYLAGVALVVLSSLLVLAIDSMRSLAGLGKVVFARSPVVAAHADTAPGEEPCSDVPFTSAEGGGQLDEMARPESQWWQVRALLYLVAVGWLLSSTLMSVSYPWGPTLEQRMLAALSGLLILFLAFRGPRRALVWAVLALAHQAFLPGRFLPLLILPALDAAVGWGRRRPVMPVSPPWLPRFQGTCPPGIAAGSRLHRWRELLLLVAAFTWLSGLTAFRVDGMMPWFSRPIGWLVGTLFFVSLFRPRALLVLVGALVLTRLFPVFRIHWLPRQLPDFSMLGLARGGVALAIMSVFVASFVASFGAIIIDMSLLCQQSLKRGIARVRAR